MTTAIQATDSTTITEQLADHIVGLRYEDIPPSVVEKAKDLLVHQFGVAFLGRGFEPAQQAVTVALDITLGDGPCSIIGERRRAGLLEAVFANSSLMQYLGLDDYLLPPGVNTGVVVQPVAWAIGEATAAPGRELLTAVVAGYDVLARLHSPVWSWDLDIPRPLKYIVAPFGAAATAARLLKLSREETVHALGHAGQAGMGTYEGTEHLWLMHPLVARNGVMAAMLARAGMPASSSVIEGRHGVYRSYFLQDVPDSLYESLSTLGREFEISKARTKRLPASALNALPIELAQQLVAQHALTPRDVAGLDLVLPQEREPREAVYDHAAKRGPRFLMAGVVVDGRFDIARRKKPADAELLAMQEKVRLRFEAGRPLRYARVEVTTTDGQLHVAEGDTHVVPPLDWGEWLAEGGREIFSDDQLTRLADLIRNLEEVPDVSEVMACVIPGE